MSRVKRGPYPRRRHNRVFKQTEGFVGSRRNRFREAVKCLMRSWEYAFVGRKDRKGDFRALWIARINAACREQGTTYSKFMFALKESGIDLDRKVLADIAVRDAAGFSKLVEIAKAA